jgi:hypothetical protein
MYGFLLSLFSLKNMKVNAVISYTVVSKELYITRKFISNERRFPPFRSVRHNIYISHLVIKIS